MNDFALFNEPEYQRYRNLQKKYSAEENEVYSSSGCFTSVVLHFGVCYVVYLLFGFTLSFILCFYGIPLSLGLAHVTQKLYHRIYRFIFKKTESYRILKSLEKRYLSQEELVGTKIKAKLGRDFNLSETPRFLSSHPGFLNYVAEAQKKIGSAYPILKRDIEKAKEIITNRSKIGQATAASDTYRPYSKTTVTKNASSKTRSARENSSNPDSVTPSQPISPSNPKPLSRTPVPATAAKEKVTPNQPRLTNWEQVNASRLKIGKRGEEFVYQYEQEKLKRLELEHLVEEIEHSSKVIGDGLGYDIKSFNRRGEPVYIEVKTTKGEFWSNLIFTRNELDFAKQNSQQFLLYRVYNFDEETGSGELYIGSYEVIETYFSFEPQSFVAKQKSVN